MWIVEMFDGIDWRRASEHSKKEDAEAQIQIYVSLNAVPPENLRVRNP